MTTVNKTINDLKRKDRWEFMETKPRNFQEYSRRGQVPRQYSSIISSMFRQRFGGVSFNSPQDSPRKTWNEPFSQLYLVATVL